MDDTEALERLLQSTAGGDSRAFTLLYERTSAKLFGVCLRMLHERGEAEDALQNVYVSVWRRASTFDPGRAAAMTWLTSLARNQCIDRLRRHRDQMTDDWAIAGLEDPDPGPRALSEATEQRQQLEQCLDTLADRQRQAVRAAFFSGDTYKELAGRMDVPLGTMKSWIRRSLMRLRACLEQFGTSP